MRNGIAETGVASIYLRGLTTILLSAAKPHERVDEQAAEEREDHACRAEDENREPSDRFRWRGGGREDACRTHETPLVAQVLHVNVRAEPSVVLQVPAVVVGVIVDGDLITVPEPVAAEAEVVGATRK
jgi:hypothetical protein